MVELQILNRVLNNKNDSILKLNNITKEYFNEYIEEYEWIMNHKEKYGNIPDIETFLTTFPEFDVLNVNESTEYLINTFKEEYLYRKSVPIMQELAEKLQVNSYDAVNYLKAQLPNLRIEDSIKGVDIISQAQSRYDEYQETKNNKDKHFIETGFKELDDATGGWHKGEELVILVARTGIGKTWVAMKMLEHAWNMNLRVGMLEPEMSANKTGYRFDTIHKNISSKALYRGDEIQGYEQYIDKLQRSNTPFFVTHPKDFDKKVTVSKLASWVESNRLDILCVDGISYLTDERAKRGDNKTSQLTNISEDLMQLSIDLKIPIIIVVQSNRGVGKGEDLELDNIRDSDGIAYNASIVLAIQQKQAGLSIKSIKYRNGANKIDLIYAWNSDLGKFDYIPQPEKSEEDKEKSENLRRQFKDKEEGEY